MRFFIALPFTNCAIFNFLILEGYRSLSNYPENFFFLSKVLTSKPDRLYISRYQKYQMSSISEQKTTFILPKEKGETSDNKV